MDKKYFETKISPRFDEIDSYGIVHHKVFFSWFEEGRFRLAEHLGVLNDIMKNDFKVLVIECGCVYKTVVRFQDRLLLRVSVDEAAGPVVFRYQVVRECDKEEVARGFTKVVILRGNTLLKKIPSEIKQKLEAYREEI